MTKLPLISVVTVCYNSKNTIERTFKSILNQTYSNIEYIVVDGMSTDGTLEIIKKYEEFFNKQNIIFKWKSEKDNGIYDAMNKGIKMATGDIVGIINSDDYYERLALEIISTEYLNDNTYDVYHGLLNYYYSEKFSMIRGVDSSSLSQQMIEHPTCFLKKTTYEKYGYFNCKYKYVADYELLCRVKRNGGKFKLIDKVIANFFDGGAGDSIDSLVEALKFKREYEFINTRTYILNLVMLRLGRIVKKMIA